MASSSSSLTPQPANNNHPKTAPLTHPTRPSSSSPPSPPTSPLSTSFLSFPITANSSLALLPSPPSVPSSFLATAVSTPLTSTTDNLHPLHHHTSSAMPLHTPLKRLPVRLGLTDPRIRSYIPAKTTLTAPCSNSTQANPRPGPEYSPSMIHFAAAGQPPSEPETDLGTGCGNDQSLIRKSAIDQGEVIPEATAGSREGGHPKDRSTSTGSCPESSLGHTPIAATAAAHTLASLGSLSWSEARRNSLPSNSNTLPRDHRPLPPRTSHPPSIHHALQNTLSPHSKQPCPMHSSTSPSPLPSPAPSMTAMSPDLQVISRQISQYPSPYSYPPHRQAQRQDHQDHQDHLDHLDQNQRQDLSSPCLSDTDFSGPGPGSGLDMAPLFPTSPSPAPQLPVDHPMTLSLSSSSAASAATSLHPLDPLPLHHQQSHVHVPLDSRAVTPPSSGLVCSSKLHHSKVPIRSPDRHSGQELMTTSTTDTESSAYMKMDYYDIYLRNPKLLRPEGGRIDEQRRGSAGSVQEGAMPTQVGDYARNLTCANPSSAPGPSSGGAYSRYAIKSKGRSKGRVSATTAATAVVVGKAHSMTTQQRHPTGEGLSRRQSMPLILTGTRRVLRHEDAKPEIQARPFQSSQDLVRRLGIQDGALTAKKPPSSRKATHPTLNTYDLSLQDNDLATMQQRSRVRPFSSHESQAIYGGGGSRGYLSEESDDEDEDGSGDKDKEETLDSDYMEVHGSHLIKPLLGGSLNRPTVGTKHPQPRSDKKARASEVPDNSGKRKRSKKHSGHEERMGQEDTTKKRKRTKKMQDPDHVSASGHRHGGERLVHEPEELVTLAPDVGPVSMLDVKSPPRVVWKGQPLPVAGKPGCDQLHEHEIHIASTLRLSPAQYLSCKQILILASRDYLSNPDGKQFRKSDAQKLCRIDVNKTSRLWEVFAKIGWLAGISAKDV